MDHYPRGRERQALTLRSGGQDERSHRGGKPKIDGNDLGLDVLHAVVDGKTGDDGTARTVDVEVDGLVAVLGIKVEHNTDDLVGELVIDFGTDEDDTLTVQTIVDVDPLGTLGSGNAVSDLGNTNGHHFDIVAVRSGRGGRPTSCGRNQRGHRLGHRSNNIVRSGNERRG